MHRVLRTRRGRASNYDIAVRPSAKSALFMGSWSLPIPLIPSPPMSQIKFYGLSAHLRQQRQKLSDTTHACIMEVLGLPASKRAHRFIHLAPEDFFMPEGRSAAYTIIEIQMMSGRTTATRKQLIRQLFDRIEAEVAISAQDLEIAIFESPAENWGFRGFHGDEVQLPYRVKV